VASAEGAFGVVVGSVALDTIETPFGTAQETLGGAAVYSSCAASILCRGVGVVGVVGGDFPPEHLDMLAARGVDLQGVQRVAGGQSFRWAGRYVGDMSTAETLDTRLGVFGDFDPQLPSAYAGAEVLFLANIQPSLQLSVLRQATGRRLVLCDTMNFWIEGARDELLEVLRQVDLVLLNDTEVRQLTGLQNLAAAAEQVLQWGPRYVVVKRGEHGASLTSRVSTGQASRLPSVSAGTAKLRDRPGEGLGLSHCFVPAYPTKAVKDPTGAGDTFAGGIVGYLCRTGDWTEGALRRALICGAALASIAVEGLGVEALCRADLSAVRARCSELAAMSVTPFQL